MKSTQHTGYWSAVFYETTKLLKDKPHLSGETAFWMARSIVEEKGEQPYIPDLQKDTLQLTAKRQKQLIDEIKE